MAASPVEAEFRELTRRLEQHHELFSMLWEIGLPIFTDSISTACIVFSSEGKPLRFLCNPFFWDQLPGYDRQFLICHEMLHAVLNHGFRSRDMLLPRFMNIAADLAVNHLLVDRFGFMRVLLQDWQSLCWVDTVFTTQGGLQLPMTNLTMEEYYDLLMNRAFQEAALVDQHFFVTSPNGSLRNVRAAAEMDALLSKLDPIGTADVRRLLGKEGAAVAMRGTERVAAWCAVEPVPPPPVPWEEIVRRRLRTRHEEQLIDGWVVPNRRYGDRIDILPPGHAFGVVRESAKRRQRGVFFLDTSGSVFHLRNRFFALVKSLPQRQFEVTACSFDMQVIQLDLKKSEIYGGGGTSFSILEKWLQSKRIKLATGKKTPYPDVVFVLTDGYGDAVNPQHPERWHWLLTTDFRSLVPKESARYLLKNFR